MSFDFLFARISEAVSGARNPGDTVETTIITSPLGPSFFTLVLPLGTT